MARKFNAAQSVVKFHQLLSDNGRGAVLTAMSYLLKGEGAYRPVPPIMGVDRVVVKCNRPFGVVAVSVRDSLLDFAQQWENNRARRDLVQEYRTELGLTNGSLPDKVEVRSHYQRKVEQLAANQQASADYVVLFRGAAGEWSTAFTVGCTDFTAGSIIEKEDDGAIIDDYDD